MNLINVFKMLLAIIHVKINFCHAYTLWKWLEICCGDYLIIVAVILVFKSQR